MTKVDAKVIDFQCPQCGCALKFTIGQIKSSEPKQCSGCGVDINTDAEGSSNAAADIREAACGDHDQVRQPRGKGGRRRVTRRAAPEPEAPKRCRMRSLLPRPSRRGWTCGERLRRRGYR